VRSETAGDFERDGCFGISVALEQHIQHGSVFIHGSPQPMGNAAHEHVHFVQMPSLASSGFTVP
jgi:hypothetical protein